MIQPVTQPLQLKSMPDSVRVLLCDDHEIVRQGLRTLLSQEPDLHIIGEAATGEEAVRMADRLEPHVVLMDVRLPGISGIEACREIRSEHPNTHVIMLTSYADDEALFTSIMAGAAGYLLKQVRGTDLVTGIRDVYAGKSLLDPIVTQRVLARLRGDTDSTDAELGDLTKQERKVLNLVAEGLTNRQIAEKLFLAEKTVKNYVSNILMKLGLSRRAEVAAYLAKKRSQKPTGNWP